MTEEIKEIELDHFNNINELKQNVETWIKEDDMYWDRWFSLYDLKTLLDYITNLQQDLDKAIDTIEKNRQFYKCRMDEYVELKKENEELNRMCELYSKSLYNAELTDYKSRCEKAIEYIKSTNCYGMRSGKTLLQKYLYELLNILNGSDENETNS